MNFINFIDTRPKEPILLIKDHPEIQGIEKIHDDQLKQIDEELKFIQKRAENIRDKFWNQVREMIDDKYKDDDIFISSGVLYRRIEK